MKTAVVYARYSCDNQTEQSIEGQLRVCQEFAKNNQILIVDTYIDRAMTGTNDNRPDFKRMLHDSNKRQWDYVIVYKLDRFSRNKYESVIHKRTLKENGIKVLSAMENIPDTPEGIILESLLEGMNQYYSAELSQKVKRGLNESYLKGQFTGGHQLYGYDIVNKKNVINPVESEVVKEIFARYAAGYTARFIANDLKKRRILTKAGKYITESMIYKLIQNKKYIGITKHNGKVYTNIYPAIIDKDVWQRVQAIRQANKCSPSRKKDVYDFVLSGKLVCGCCKRMIVGESGTSCTGKIYYYYSCLSRRRKKAKCNFQSVNKQWLEDLVIQTTWHLLNEKNLIEEISNRIYALHAKMSKEQVNLKALENKRNEAVKASQNLIAALEQGIVTEQTKTRLKELETIISQYEFDIEQEKQRNYVYLTPEKIKQYLTSAMKGDMKLISARKTIIRYLIREIIVDNEKVIITYNFSDTHLSPKEIPDDIDAVKQTAETVMVNSSNDLDRMPPRVNKTNRLSGSFFT